MKSAVLDGHPLKDVTLEPLDDFLVLEPLEDTETPSGLIVPVNEATHVRIGIVASVGPDVTAIEPGDKVLYARDAGYELAGKHHEIYLSDPRRTAPARLKTILRHPVAKHRG